MNNEDKILQMLSAMNERLDAMQGEQKKTNERLDLMQAQTNARFDVMQDEQKKTNERLDTMQEQLNENTEIIKAVLHNQEYANAKLEGLELTTAKSSVAQEISERCMTIEDKLNVLNDDLFTQKAEIKRLKLVK